jgi:hypothetical protein
MDAKFVTLDLEMVEIGEDWSFGFQQQICVFYFRFRFTG